MTTYISLLNWTAQGISDVRDSVDRVHQGESLFKPFGARITHAYWTQGEYDLVVISEAPDDESMAAAMLALAGKGNVRSRTLRAFGEQEFQGILKKLG